MRQILPYARYVLALIGLASVGAYIFYVRFPKPTAPTLTGSITSGTLHVGDRDRTFAYYAPAALPAHPALLLALHGSGETGDEFRWHSGYGFDRVADAHGVVVVYPDGYEHHWDDCRASTSTSARTLRIDDVGFARALIAYFQAKLGIDPSRVFAAGHSGGGQLAYRLALEMPDEVRAVAAISASLPTDDNLDCQPSGKPVPVLIMNGTDDPLNPYLGGVSSFFGLAARGTVRSSIGTALYFARLDHLPRNPLAGRFKGGNAALWVERWTWGSGPMQVVLDSVHGGGHTVPQSVSRYPRILGKTDNAFDGPGEIWRFFEETSAAPPSAAPTLAASAAASTSEGDPDGGASDAGGGKARPGGRLGSPCTPGSCGPGLGCCETGFVGHCGGDNMPGEAGEPCVMTRTCAPTPCQPMSLPP